VGEPRADIVVIGGGPAGSTLAWRLARDGARVVLLERTRFPREKVCGDYVEPRGLAILQEMGCLATLDGRKPLPITTSSTYVDGVARYRGPIPFYGRDDRTPPHGYIVPRDDLDTVMLEAAEVAGATVHQETGALGVAIDPTGVDVEARHKGRITRYRAALVAGADGVNSVVASAGGVLSDDERHIAVARRAYATGMDADVGEAMFWFDRSLFPGYGWVFPMSGGRVNVGIGLLAETRRRQDVAIPALFATFLERLRASGPPYDRLELCSTPIGGIVKTYGGAGPRVLDRGVLVGDAGSFVDPMTGEGITPAMESALLAAPVLLDALQTGRAAATDLAAYDTDARAYFDPSMRFLVTCASTLRNPHLARPWLDALARGCEMAQADETFAREASAYFGGQNVRPTRVMSAIIAAVVRDMILAWPRTILPGAGRSRGTTLTDLMAWQAAWARSLFADPVWHLRWSMEVQRKWIGLVAGGMVSDGDPRTIGPDAWRAKRDAKGDSENGSAKSGARTNGRSRPGSSKTSASVRRRPAATKPPTTAEDTAATPRSLTP
jgi:geranylgeranyl reductase family protein